MVGNGNSDECLANNQEVNGIKQPPQGTFERTAFDQLLCQYDLRHDLPPTVEIT
jgi:hypothetical protein